MLYTPENKIVQSISKIYGLYYYKIRLHNHNYAHFIAYNVRVNTCYLYDYTEFLRKQMSINAIPDNILELYYSSNNSDIICTKHNISKLTLPRIKEIVDNNFALLTEFNNYIADYELVRSIEAM